LWWEYQLDGQNPNTLRPLTHVCTVGKQTIPINSFNLL
jgi:hypothetical protein